MVCVKETKIKHPIGYIYSREMQCLPIMRRGLSLAEYYIQNYTKYVGYKKANVFFLFSYSEFDVLIIRGYLSIYVKKFSKF